MKHVRGIVASNDARLVGQSLPREPLSGLVLGLLGALLLAVAFLGIPV